MAITEPMVAQREELCENATRGPEVYLYSVECIAIEQLRRSVVSSGDVRHASSGKRLAELLLSFQRLVVIRELLCTAEVADLEARLPAIVLPFSVDQNVVRLDVPVGDSFTVEVVEPLEELVSHLLDSFEPSGVLYASGSRRLLELGVDTLPRVDIIFAEITWHKVAD